MADIDWIRRPVAHRGLHDISEGIIENTPSAFQAAIDAGYGIECDLQEAADGVAMLHHDARLGRLTEGEAPLKSLSSAELKQVRFKATSDRMQTLNEFLEQVSGRVPLLIEIKSDWRERGSLERRIAHTLDRYKGPAAVMSFDPDSVGVFTRYRPHFPRGLVADNYANDDHWGHLSPGRRFLLRHLLYGLRVRPHFISYGLHALPAPGPLIARKLFGLPLMIWTIRTEKQREEAERWGDGITFEFIRP